jgi:hypothetical protein
MIIKAMINELVSMFALIQLSWLVTTWSSAQADSPDQGRRGWNMHMSERALMPGRGV